MIASPPTLLGNTDLKCSNIQAGYASPVVGINSGSEVFGTAIDEAEEAHKKRTAAHKKHKIPDQTRLKLADWFVLFVRCCALFVLHQAACPRINFRAEHS